MHLPSSDFCSRIDVFAMSFFVLDLSSLTYQFADKPFSIRIEFAR